MRRRAEGGDENGRDARRWSQEPSSESHWGGANQRCRLSQRVGTVKGGSLRIMAKPRPVQGLAKHYRRFIDGEWVDSNREETIDVVNPATERVIASVPKASREQAKAALEAAEAAQPKWEEFVPLQLAAVLLYR